jgi:hypothetical protein
MKNLFLIKQKWQKNQKEYYKIQIIKTMALEVIYMDKLYLTVFVWMIVI